MLRPAGLVVGGGALVVALGALAVRHVRWSNTFVVAAASVSTIVLLAAAVVAVVAFTAVRSRLPAVLAGAALIVGISVQAPRFVADGIPMEHAMSVLTSNIQLGKGDVDHLAGLVRSQRVDLLAIQELTPAAADRVASSTIAADLPYSVVHTAKLAGGTALYSRYPLAKEQVLDGFILTNLTASVRVPGRGDVHVLVAHPVPPTHVDWAEELSRIGTIMAAFPREHPVIAIGDFNATVDNALFRGLLTGGYRDAGEVAGAGWLPTYPTDKAYPPLVGIDHVLVRGLGASDVASYSIDGADHRAVMATVG